VVVLVIPNAITFLILERGGLYDCIISLIGYYADKSYIHKNRWTFLKIKKTSCKHFVSQLYTSAIMNI
jgi:hypothetical protein